MNAGTPVQPSLESLMAGYLKRQAEAEALGLGRGEGLEVTPYEAGPVQPIDPKVAFDEGLAVLAHFGVSAKMKAPAGWVALVAQAEPQVAIAFAVGNYPQLVRDFHTLLQQTDLAALRPIAQGPLSVPALNEWLDRGVDGPQTVLAVAACRMTRQFDVAHRFLAQPAPAGWEAVWENERAALLWHEGKANEAIALWRAQPTSLPVRFNLAMAELFTGGKAATLLENVMSELPERSAWYHLARLYHTLSVLRGSK